LEFHIHGSVKIFGDDPALGVKYNPGSGIANRCRRPRSGDSMGEVVFNNETVAPLQNNSGLPDCDAGLYT
jgi:hypothetical protein